MPSAAAVLTRKLSARDVARRKRIVAANPSLWSSADSAPNCSRLVLMAFVVWFVCTLAWLNLSEELLPLWTYVVSVCSCTNFLLTRLPCGNHQVGFGFFLVLITRKTRWLGALLCGAVAVSLALRQTLPMTWLAVASHAIDTNEPAWHAWFQCAQLIY
jgi:hypothetical protein